MTKHDIAGGPPGKNMTIHDIPAGVLAAHAPNRRPGPRLSLPLSGGAGARTRLSRRRRIGIRGYEKGPPRICRMSERREA